jgi:hypothetical protein
MFAESYSAAPPSESENDERSYRSVPLSVNVYCWLRSGPFTS